MKLQVYFNELEMPNQIRIVSEALCLDHTFSCAASVNPVGIKEIRELMAAPFIDRVYVEFCEGSGYILGGAGIRFELVGWMKMSADEIDLHEMPEEEIVEE